MADRENLGLGQGRSEEELRSQAATGSFAGLFFLLILAIAGIFLMFSWCYEKVVAMGFGH